MPAEIIDGKALAARIERTLAAEVAELGGPLGRPPGLAVVLVGDNPASKVYVASKSRRAKKCGIAVTDVALPAAISDAELHEQLRQLSAREDIDGILLQLPLPGKLSELDALSCIAPEKDVDGLHPYSQGLLLRGADVAQPCTPKGSVLLIEEGRRLLGQSSDLTGLHAVVVGRSILVGKPMGLLLLERNCTVTLCHSRTKDLAEECRRADIIVAAAGRPGLLGADAIKPGSIVIDVGINRLDDGSLAGDVDLEAAFSVAGAVTPVPGGVGPMTIAMLMSNTVDAARKKLRARV